MEFLQSDRVVGLVKSYPNHVSKRLLALRQLVIECAEELEISKLLETTKWGEPSYVTKTGSTIRMDWKSKTPEKYYLFFICNTELVNTFRFVFGDELDFEGDRAIVFDLNEPLPEAPIRRCLKLALTYHKVKHLPMLGA
ncbi:MAG: DUF1801 domain-containing protein [Marinoscillum sp.]